METRGHTTIVNVATCRVNLAICEAALDAMVAVTARPDMSAVVDSHNEACAAAYWNLQSALAEQDADVEAGTEEEWDALSPHEQAVEWDEFHSLCAQGTADTMYFYKVLMGLWIKGYAGH